MKRKDYSRIINGACKALENDFNRHKFIVADDQLNTTPSDDFHELISIYVELNKSFPKTIRADQKHRLCLYLNYCIAVPYLIRIIDNPPELVVFFADMQPIENMISQYLRKSPP